MRAARKVENDGAAKRHRADGEEKRAAGGGGRSERIEGRTGEAIVRVCARAHGAKVHSTRKERSGNKSASAKGAGGHETGKKRPAGAARERACVRA